MHDLCRLTLVTLAVNLKLGYWDKSLYMLKLINVAMHPMILFTILPVTNQ